MPFEYACFISYRHLGGYYERVVTDLQKALDEVMPAFMGSKKTVYRDILKAQYGQDVDKTLARAICQSVCMICIYAPPYFDLESTYCAREFYAMKRLEQVRFQVLGDDADGFIVPVILVSPGVIASVDFASVLRCGSTLHSARPQRLPIITDRRK